MNKRSKPKTNQWLRRTELGAEIEGLITALDQSLPTEDSYARIVKVDASPLCKIYRRHEQTVDNFITSYQECAKS